MSSPKTKQKKPKDPNFIAPFQFKDNINCKQGVIESSKVDAYYKDFYMDSLFSGRNDTLFFAHEVNQMNNLPQAIAKEMKYRFYYHGLSENHNRKYPPVYGKDDFYKDDEYVLAIMEYYKFSREKALQVREWLPYEELEKYLEYIDKGGKNGKKDDKLVEELYKPQPYWCADAEED